MRPDKAQNLKECTIKQGVAGITLFAFLLTQVVSPLPVSAQDTLRQEPIPEATGLEELKDALQAEKRSVPALAPSTIAAAGMEESLIRAHLREALSVIEVFKQIVSIGTRKAFRGSVLEKSADELKGRLVGFQNLWDEDIRNFVEYLREREQQDPPTELQLTARVATARAAKIPASGIFFLSPEDMEAWLIINPQSSILKQPQDYYGQYNTPIERNPFRTSFPRGVFFKVTDKQGRTRKLIVVRNDLPPSRTFLTLAHEAVHFLQGPDRNQIYGWKFYRLIIEAIQNDLEQKLAGEALKILQQEGFFETKAGREVFPVLAANIGPIIRHLVVSRFAENRFINSIRTITGPRALVTLHRKYSTKALEKKLGTDRLLALRDFFQIPTTIPKEIVMKLATHLVLEDPHFQQPQRERLLAIPGVVTFLFPKATSRSDLSFPLIEYRNRLGEEPAINLARDFVRGKISEEEFSDSLYEVVKKPPTTAGLEETIREVPGNPRYKTYVVAESLFSLMSTGEGGRILAKHFGPQSALVKRGSSAGDISAMGQLRSAAAMNLAGAAELLRLITEEEVILLRAASVLEPPDVDEATPPSPFWDRTAAEVVMSTLWEERLHMSFDRLEPSVQREILDVISQSDHKLMNKIRQAVEEDYATDLADLVAYESLLILLLLRDDQRVDSLVQEIFPGHLQSIVRQIKWESHPSLEEVTGTRTIAEPLRSSLQDQAYDDQVGQKYRPLFEQELNRIKTERPEMLSWGGRFKATVIPPGSADPFEAPWVAEKPLDERRERFVTDPLRIFYQVDSTGASAVNLVQTSIRAREIPGLRPQDVQILKLSEGQTPDPYTIVVKAADEILPQEELWRQNHVAIVIFAPQMTLAQLIQEALSQWTRRPIGEILQIDHLGGRLGIYA